MNEKRVLVGLSGGVDSSVCALLLQRQDYTVLGATLDLCDVRLRQHRGCQSRGGEAGHTLCGLQFPRRF